MPRRRCLALGVGLAVVAPLTFLGGPASAAPLAVQPYDVNADGYPELVVGAPNLTSRGDADGGIAVLASSRSGPSAKAQVIDPATLGLAVDTYGMQEFGDSLASGDFDGDGYADLAIGRPAAYKRYEGAGAVTVLFGSAKGLAGTRAQELLEPGGPDGDVGFGASVVAADLNGNGYADLAVSAPNAEDSDRHRGQGTVSVFTGSSKGFAQDRSSVLRGDRTAAAFDQYFGERLAVGDLDLDGRPDLVVGSTGDTARKGEAGHPGSVSACYGAPGNLTGCTRLLRDPALAATRAIAVGNVTGTARPEIVVGGAAYDDELGGRVESLSLSGPRTATTVTRTELTQNSPGVRGSAEKGDEFGTDVVLGDLDADGYADLVVGAPGEDKDKGRVTVVYGGAKGYRTSGGKIYDQDTKGVPGKAEKHDRFGDSVALLDHDRDGHLDLTVGAPVENDGDGAITLLRGSGSSFTTKGARTDTLNDLGYPASRLGGLGEALGR